MIAYLINFDASEGYNQIIDFLNGSSIKYALTINHNIYMSCIKQFWTSIDVKKVNDVMRLQALVNKKKVIITKASIGDALRLDDSEGIECLLNEEIFAELARIGYEKPLTKLTFYKAFFSSQWKFFIHTILKCMSAKRTSWNEFSSSMLSAVISLSTGDVSVANDEVPTGVEEPSIPSPTPPTPPPQPSQDQPLTSQDKIAQDLEITKLKPRVKKLERKNKASKLKRLKKDVVLEDASKDVAVKNSADVDESAEVSSMQDDKGEPAELQKVVDVVTTTTQLILLVERRYPLPRFTLDQMLNNLRLEVEEKSKVSLELLSFGVDAAEDFKENMLSV
uniref:Xylulose kinase-1 n=1 Tax=Tanacetum cinerariifolium TaxID=118510 RepID=A0A6L2JRA6_TANCI|nr:hypothetical protein [Tanacetum cinerariifolium]